MNTHEEVCFSNLQLYLKITDHDNFEAYLRELFYNTTPDKEEYTMNKIIFSELMNLPLFISNRIFETFDNK